MRKLLGAELQLGVILFLVTVPVLGALTFLVMEMGVNWAQMLMDPLNQPGLVFLTLIYTGWGLTVLWIAFRRVPQTDEDGYIQGDH